MKFGVILSGFTMIEMLLALVCISIFIPMVVQGMEIIRYDQSVYVQEMEDMMGIEQLRLYLAKGTITVATEKLMYQTNKEYYLEIINHHLTLHPGNLVFLTDVDDVLFYEMNNAICMKYTKNGNEYDVWIGYK